MSEEFVKNSLYKPFTQENDNVRTRYQGTGLGMSIVSELVTIMKGTIDVDSKLGKGTVFTVNLPVDIDPSPENKKTKGEKKADISGMYVLVAEDNQLNLEIARYMLEEAGVKVALAENGKEAMEIFEKSQPGEFDAILMDIMMPVMNGYEAAEKIRKLDRPDAETIPIIAMTANAFSEDRKKSKEAGMDDHLIKPVNGEQLHETLSRYRRKKEV